MENEAKDKYRKILLQSYLVVKFCTMTYRSQNRGDKLNYRMYIWWNIMKLLKRFFGEKITHNVDEYPQYHELKIR